MAENSSADSCNSVQKRDEYNDEFSRIVFMVDQINRAKFSRTFNPSFSKLFLAGYFKDLESRPDLMKCFRDLPQEPNPLYPPPAEEFQVVPASSGQTAAENKEEDAGENKKEDAGENKKEDAGKNKKEDTGKNKEEDAEENKKEDAGKNKKEDAGKNKKEDAGKNKKEDAGKNKKEDAGKNKKEDAGKNKKEDAGKNKEEDSKQEPTPIELSSFLLLLEELRIGLAEGTIDPSARWDILKIYLNILGPRRDLISRVLYYLYPPTGTFVTKEASDAPSELADARKIYPTENLAFSLLYVTKDALKTREYRRYASLWDDVRQRIVNDKYSKKDSKEDWRKFSEVLSPYKKLMRMLSKIPWPHKTELSTVKPPSTPTRKSSADEKISGRST